MSLFGKRTGNGLPILIANGFAPFPLPLHLVQLEYWLRGFSSHVIPFRLIDNRDVNAYARHVADSVDRLCQREGLAKINLIGISLGAVAGLAAIKRLGIAPRVATFVAVGGPLMGTDLAWAGLPTGIFTGLSKQLLPASRFVRKLADEPLPNGPRYLAVAGSNDIVCPVWTALFPGAMGIVLKFHHFGVVGDPGIADAVAPYLGRLPPSSR
jgi:pimeloyl-ACP methyl ester carboxylesterase